MYIKSPGAIRGFWVVFWLAYLLRLGGMTVGYLALFMTGLLFVATGRVLRFLWSRIKK